MSKHIQPGTSVMFSRAFLRSTGQFTGRAPFIKGTVESIDDLGQCQLALIQWADGDLSRVNVKNLVATNRRHLEP